jgi:hypothetical protein
MSVEEARTSLVCVPDEPQPANQYLVIVGNIIFRYRLLDIVADVLDSPRHQALTDIPKSTRPKNTTGRLDAV